jgi:hypothetical protein
MVNTNSSRGSRSGVFRDDRENEKPSSFQCGDESVVNNGSQNEITDFKQIIKKTAFKHHNQKTIKINNKEPTKCPTPHK